MTLRSTLPIKFAASFYSIDFPVQNRTVFELLNQEMNLDALTTNNLFLIAMISNFNAKLSN